jgi:hypothetical protein
VQIELSGHQAADARRALSMPAFGDGCSDNEIAAGGTRRHRASQGQRRKPHHKRRCEQALQ